MDIVKPVLVLGSAPNVLACKSLPKSLFSSIVAINNAWQVREDWDYHIAPDDFPLERMPQNVRDNQTLVRSDEYVPANNAFGGIIYAGATMAFSTGYWVLSALKPPAMVFFGCDMVYQTQGNGHFYGSGTADPLRDDVTLRNLEAKSARLMLHAAMQDCACLRPPNGDSRLVFPIAEVSEQGCTDITPPVPDVTTFRMAKNREAELGYFVESGRYWESDVAILAKEVDLLDQLWIGASLRCDAGQRVSIA